MPETLFGLLRHGKTQWNEEKRIQGRFDSPLTPDGICGVKDWVPKLLTCKWDRIISSPLGRAKHTANLLNDSLKLPISFEDQLQEQNWGDWEGLKLEEVKKANAPYLEQQIRAGWDFTPMNGESRTEVHERVDIVLKKYNQKWPNEKVLVITHQSVIKCILYSIMKKSFLPEEKTKFKKNMLHTIRCNSGDFHLEQLNISKVI